MKITKKISMAAIGLGILGLAATVQAQGTVVVGQPYYGYGPAYYGGGGYPPPGYGPGYGPGYYPPPGTGVYGYPGYYQQNPALQNPLSPASPYNLNRAAHGKVPVVAPNPAFYDGGADYYLY